MARFNSFLWALVSRHYDLGFVLLDWRPFIYMIKVRLPFCWFLFIFLFFYFFIFFHSSH